MAEEQQEPQQVQRVTTKNLKKVEAGKRLSVHSRRKGEELKAKKREEQKGDVNQYYGIGAVIAMGVTGGLGYHIYQSKKGEANAIPQPNPPPKTNKSVLQNGQEEYSK